MNISMTRTTQSYQVGIAVVLAVLIAMVNFQPFASTARDALSAVAAPNTCLQRVIESDRVPIPAFPAAPTIMPLAALVGDGALARTEVNLMPRNSITASPVQMAALLTNEHEHIAHPMRAVLTSIVTHRDMAARLRAKVPMVRADLERPALYRRGARKARDQDFRHASIVRSQPSRSNRPTVPEVA